MRLPSEVNRVPVGYQPTGRKPFTRDSRDATLTTATVLLSAFATRSVPPSGESPRALGVLPAGAFGSRAIEIRSVTFREARSTRQTAFVLAQATKTEAPSRESTMAAGCSPTSTSPWTARARRIHEQDPGAAPERDQEGLPVLRQEARVGFGGQRHHALDVSRFQIDRGERESERIDDEESAPVGRDVEPGEKARLELFAERDALLLLELPILPEEDVDGVVASRRGIEPASVGAEGEAQPGVAGLERLPDHHSLDVDDGQRRARDSGGRDHRAAAVGRFDDRDGEIAHGDVAARRIDAPAVRQERGVAFLAGSIRVRGRRGQERPLPPPPAEARDVASSR